MSWSNSEDAMDYDDFASPIYLAKDFGVPAHLLDITLTAEDDPGTLVVVWNADRQAGQDGSERTHTISRSGPFVGNIRTIVSATGIDLIRAQFPFAAKNAP